MIKFTKNIINYIVASVAKHLRDNIYENGRERQLPFC